MIVVTGGDGFIGSNIIKAVKEKITTDVLCVDYTNKRQNSRWCHPDDFLRYGEHFRDIEAIFHNGANSSTTASNVFDVMHKNFDYPATLLMRCIRDNVKFIYASSASVYGDGPFKEDSRKQPKNLYAKSKAIFDDYTGIFSTSKGLITGLRYYNVYGRNEEFKGDMASIVYKFYKQHKATGAIKLFENSQNYRRDFIHIDDVVDVNLGFFKSTIGGIYNVGTGVSRSFRDIADIFVQRYNCKIEEIPMPDKLIGKYQTFTESDNTKLSSEIKKSFMSLEQGVNKYLDFLETQ